MNPTAARMSFRLNVASASAFPQIAVSITNSSSGWDPVGRQVVEYNWNTDTGQGIQNLRHLRICRACPRKMRFPMENRFIFDKKRCGKKERKLPPTGDPEDGFSRLCSDPEHRRNPEPGSSSERTRRFEEREVTGAAFLRKSGASRPDIRERDSDRLRTRRCWRVCSPAPARQTPGQTIRRIDRIGLGSGETLGIAVRVLEESEHVVKRPIFEHQDKDAPNPDEQD